MWSHSLIAWCSQRISEATSDFSAYFGGIPIVNLFGDFGQMGPIVKSELHTCPMNSSSAIDQAGYAIIILLICV